MMVCFYCETKNAIKNKFNRPCCNDCDMDLFASMDFKDRLKLERELNDDDLAKRHKVFIKTFGLLNNIRR